MSNAPLFFRRPQSARVFLSLFRGEITVPFAQCWREIAAEVAQRYGITLDELLSRRRARKYARPRQEAMARVHREAGLSKAAVARLFRRDPSTVIHAIRVVEAS